MNTTATHTSHRWAYRIGRWFSRVRNGLRNFELGLAKKAQARVSFGYTAVRSLFLVGKIAAAVCLVVFSVYLALLILLITLVAFLFGSSSAKEEEGLTFHKILFDDKQLDSAHWDDIGINE